MLLIDANDLVGELITHVIDLRLGDVVVTFAAGCELIVRVRVIGRIHERNVRITDRTHRYVDIDRGAVIGRVRVDLLELDLIDAAGMIVTDRHGDPLVPGRRAGLRHAGSCEHGHRQTGRDEECDRRPQTPAKGLRQDGLLCSAGPRRPGRTRVRAEQDDSDVAPEEPKINQHEPRRR
jgi:hypothetical protein